MLGAPFRHRRRRRRGGERVEPLGVVERMPSVFLGPAFDEARDDCASVDSRSPPLAGSSSGENERRTLASDALLLIAGQELFFLHGWKEVF